MSKSDIIKFVVITSYILLFTFVSCNDRASNRIAENYKVKIDSVETYYFNKRVEDANIIDSLTNKTICDKIVIDSLREDNFVMSYKLERISYYNDIAKNGNNIKFLRGWINRVLTE